jgi:hypothetical protein
MDAHFIVSRGANHLPTTVYNTSYTPEDGHVGRNM